MRDYAKISGRYWTGGTGRELRQLGGDAQLMGLYLMTAPNSNMLGLYYLPLPTLAHELRSPLEGALETLRRVEKTGFCRYDETSETVWVVNMAREQVGESLAAADNRVKSIHKQLEEYRKCPFYNDFHAMYRDSYHLGVLREDQVSPSPFEAPSKPLRSQEQEQEQEQEKEQKQNPGSPPAPLGSTNAVNASATSKSGNKSRKKKLSAEEEKAALATWEEANLPGFIPRPEWDAFKAMRDDTGQPVTVSVAISAVGKLRRLETEGHSAGLVLEKATLGRFRGLFEGRDTLAPPPPKPKMVFEEQAPGEWLGGQRLVN